MDQYNKIIEEKGYCDESQLLIEEYSYIKPIDLHDQLNFMQKWVIDDNRNALIITGQAETGTKTLLCSFLRQNKKQHPQWLHLAHFASITPIYSNILYKIMIQLRNHFKIEQKVDLNEQKLRRYFKYWLQIISEFLQKQYLGYNKNDIPKVVIVLEGIDSCVDLKGNLVQHKFWLPSHIPSNIKLIITTKNDCHTIQNSSPLHHYMSHQRRLKIINKFCEKTHNLNERYRDEKLYNLILIEKMVRAKPQFVISGNNFEQILKNYINNVSDSTLSEQEIKSLLYSLTLTRKGLKYKWLQRIINLSYQKWQNFLKYFDFFIVSSYNYYTICNPKAKKLIQMLVDPQKQKVRAYRNSIIRAFKNQSLHFRGLQQIVYQLLITQNFSELKEVICRIQNFIMLYTPFSKELLCQCWVRLQQLEQFDPVFEYNKAIEAYSSHYYPKQEDLYKIIFQISIFFKQYSEFQNAKTPKFRHPLIKGQVGHLQEIGIYDQVKLLEIVGKCKIYKLKPLQNLLEKSLSKLKSKEKQSSKKDKSPNDKYKQKMTANESKKKTEFPKSSNKIDKQSHQTQKNLNAKDQTESQRPTTTQLTLPLTEVIQIFNVQELNVGIVSNQEKFRQFFTEQMKQYLENYFAPLKKNIYKDKELAFESQQSDNQQESCKNKEEKDFKVDIQKIKESLILKKYKEYLEEDYHKNGEEVTYYYYKQWIWLQFPWICQTVKHIYSQMINQCLPGSIHFMSPTKEFSLIKEVLKITKTAKQNKMGIYTQKIIEILPIKNPQFRLQKMRMNDQKQSSYCVTKRSKIEQDPNRSYKIDLSRIQLEIVKEKQQQIKLLEKTNTTKNLLKAQTSMPSLNMFITQNNGGQSRLLPNIKKSNFGTAEPYVKRQKQNKNQNNRDYTMIVRKFNQLKHDNEILVQKIEEMKRLQMQTVDKNQQQIQKISKNIVYLQDKQVQIQKNLKNQQELSKKLDIILKICDLNKMYGSQTDYLSTYLENLKFMIGIEDNRSKKTKESINQTVQNAKLQIKTLKQKKKELKIAKDQKFGPKNLATDSTNPHLLNLQFEQIQNQLKQMNKFIKSKSKKTKLKQNHYFRGKDYQQLEQQIGIKYGDPINETKIQDFADKYQKLNVLKLKKIDLKAQCSALQKRIAQRKYEDKVLQGKDKGKIKLGGIVVQKKKQLIELKNRSQLLQNALQSITIPQQ